MLFPAATHTRKEHSFGALKRTQILTEKWVKRGFIKEKEAKLMQAYALWHDLGHGPFSHVVESVTKELWNHDHDQNGAKIIDNLKKPVTEVGLDIKELKKFFTKENPLYLGVHDKNLGTEKLDYLSRDAYYTIGEIPGVEYVTEHTYFIDKKIMIDEKAIDNAKALQDFYVKMFKTVYLRKNSSIAQRMMQKMMFDLINLEKIKESEMWAMRDFEILSRLINSKDKNLRESVNKFLDRDLPRTAIALKINRFTKIDEVQYKSQTIIGVSENQMKSLGASPILESPSQLKKLEQEIAKMAKLPDNSILVVPPTSQDRFVPKDIDIYVSGNSCAKLSDYFKDHYRSIEEEGKSYAVVRVCTFKEYRDKLSDKIIAEKVKDYLLSLL